MVRRRLTRARSSARRRAMRSRTLARRLRFRLRSLLRRGLRRTRTWIRRTRARTKWWAIRFWKRNADVAFHDRRFARRTAQVLEGDAFDVYLAHDTLSLVAGRSLARRDRAPLLLDAVEIPRLSARVGPFFRNQRPWVRLYLDLSHRRGMRSADRIITIGPSMARWLEAQYGPRHPVAVVRNAPAYQPVNRQSSIRDDLDLASGDRLILFVNTVAPGYGIEALIEATALLDKTVHVAVLGPVVGFIDSHGATRPYLAHLDARVAELGVEDRFHFLGMWPGDQLVDYASGADLGVITTLPGNLNVQLSLPNRIFSYISAGLPVVTSAIPDIADIVERYGIGEVVPEQTPEALAATAGRLLGDGALARMRGNTERAARELCWQTEAERLLNLFQEVRDGRPAGRRVCFLARKDVTSNARTQRIAQTLTENGFSVTVVAGKVPESTSPFRVPDVEYIAVGIA